MQSSGIVNVSFGHSYLVLGLGNDLIFNQNVIFLTENENWKIDFPLECCRVVALVQPCEASFSLQLRFSSLGGHQWH